MDHWQKRIGIAVVFAAGGLAGFAAGRVTAERQPFDLGHSIYDLARGYSDYVAGCTGKIDEVDEDNPGRGRMKNAQALFIKYIADRNHARVQKSVSDKAAPPAYSPSNDELKYHFEQQVSLFDKLRLWQRSREKNDDIECTDDGSATETALSLDWMLEQQAKEKAANDH